MINRFFEVPDSDQDESKGPDDSKEEKFPDNSSTGDVVPESPETPLLQPTTPTPPPTPTAPVLRAHSSSAANLDSAISYTEIQEHEAATRQLRRQLNSPKLPTATQPMQSTQRRNRRRQGPRSLSASLASLVPERVSWPPVQAPRPLQKRKAHQLPSIADVAQHGRLYDHINNGNRQQWIATCAHLLRRYQLASIADDTAEKTDAFADLLLLPAQILTKVGRGGKRSSRRGHRSPTTAIRQRLAQQLSGLSPGDTEEQQEEKQPAPHSHPASHPLPITERDTALPTSPHIPIPLSAADCDVSLDPFDGLYSAADKSAASRANRLAHHGHIRKAAHVLNTTSEKADLRDPDVVHLLDSLHPQLPEGSLFPPLPTDAPLIHLDDDDSEIHRIIRQSNSGASAGPSGWGGNMVSILGDDTRCSTALVRLLQDIVNHNITDGMRDLLLPSSLVAIKKPSGGLRPIAIGELFYRMAAVIAVRRVRSAAAPLLAPHQFGFGVRNGCEHIVHSLQHALTDQSHPLAALQLDLTNAFNSVNRTRLLTAVYAIPQLAPIWRLVTLAYACVSPLLLDRERGLCLHSSNGVRQGDPLSSLLFCVYIKNVLDEVSDGCQVQPYACMDDIHLVGEPRSLMDALQRLQHTLPELELHINTSKSHLAYFHQDAHPLPSDVLETCADNRIPIEHQHLRVLGAMVACDETHLTSALREAAASDYSTTPFFHRLSSPQLAPQAAILLLRQCGVPKMNYLARCTPPVCLAPIAAAFDAMVVDTAYTKLEVADGERTAETLRCLRNRLKLGGFGLTSVELSSPAAFVASLAALALSTAAPALLTSPDQSLPADSLLHSWIESTLAALRRDFAVLHAVVPDARRSQVLDKLPAAADEFFSHFQASPGSAVKLQHFLNQQATQLRFYAAVEEARQFGGAQQLAHLPAHSAPHASAWKVAMPTRPTHTLSAAHYVVSARQNLRLRPYRTLLPDDCASCGGKDAIKRDPWHHLSCNSHKRQEINLRHDSVVNALFHHSNHSGAAACKEPQGLSSEDGRRPDLHIVLPDASILTDVVITHPLAPSHVSLATTGALAVAQQAAVRKQHKYKQVADTQRARFIPFACETTGGISRGAEQLIDQLSLACKDHLTLPSHRSIAHSVHHSIAIAIQRGNALAIQAGYSRAVMRARRGWRRAA